MAWIESHQELWRHPKTKKLARLLGVSIPTAVGHLHGLWFWALDFAQDGYLSPFEAEDIADAVLWEGDPGVLLNALVTSGFADSSDSGLFIHDWWDYAGRLIDRRKADAERKRTSRGKLNISADSPLDIHGTSEGQPKDGERSPSLPYSTGQDLTEQNNDPTVLKGNDAPKSAKPKLGERANADKFDDEMFTFVDWYFERYKTVKGHPHPNLKADQRKRIFENLSAFVDDPNYAIDYDVLRAMAESFFVEVKDSDYNLNHFATEGMLKIRFYATQK